MKELNFRNEQVSSIVESKSIAASARANLAPRQEGVKNQINAKEGRGVDIVLYQFQQLMERFLETQRQVMLAYLGGGINDSSKLSDDFDSAKVIDTLTEGTNGSAETQISSEIPPYQETTTKLEERSLNGDAARAVDSAYSGDKDSEINREQLTNYLLQMVSERTGYPPDMIDLDYNVEAGLGIDSIKWVEILGTLQDSYLQIDQTQAQVAMEELVNIKSLRGVIDWIEHKQL